MKSKATLEPGYHRVFVDLCAEKKVLGDMLVMKQLVEPLQQRTDRRFTLEKLKSHWDAMVKEWTIWSKLVECNDMKWDPNTETFGASDEDWDNYLQANPDAGSYRFSPPLFLKKLETIFEGSNYECSNDNEAGSSKRKRKRGNEEEEVDNSTHEKRRWWGKATHELFLDLLVQETSKGNKPIRWWPKENWSMIVETINRNTGNNYTIKQVKNHWDMTRKAWKIWCEIVGADILKWDPNTRKFGATDADWKRYIKENPRAVNFRRKQIPCADKLAIIFNGYFSDTLQIHHPTPLSTFYTNEPENEDEPDNDDDDDDGDDDERMSEKMESTKRDEFTISECIECLDSMQEVEEGSDLYLFALDLFLRKEYREIFLQFKHSSSRMSWMLKLQSDRSVD